MKLGTFLGFGIFCVLRWMGNTWVGPSTLGKSGFIQSVTAAVWRTNPPPDERLPPPSKIEPSDTNADSRDSMDREGSSAPVTPPSTEKMDGNPVVEQEKQPVKPHVERKPSEVSKPKAVHVKRGSSPGL